MLRINTIKRGSEIGKHYYTSYIWHKCCDCGKRRWVKIVHDKPQSLRCLRCSQRTYEHREKKSRKMRGSRSPLWKGGRIKTNGYIRVKISPRSFFFPMTDCQGYVLGHRLKMAKHLGRYLKIWEIVHHKNGIRDDNRIRNLDLITKIRHDVITALKNRNKILEKRIKELEGRLKKYENFTIRFRQNPIP